jgi:hypothetical protein
MSGILITVCVVVEMMLQLVVIGLMVAADRRERQADRRDRRTVETTVVTETARVVIETDSARVFVETHSERVEVSRRR